MPTKSGLWPRLFFVGKSKKAEAEKLQPFESSLFEDAGNGCF